MIRSGGRGGLAEAPRTDGRTPHPRWPPSAGHLRSRNNNSVGSQPNRHVARTLPATSANQQAGGERDAAQVESGGDGRDRGRPDADRSRGPGPRTVGPTRDRIRRAERGGRPDHRRSHRLGDPASERRSGRRRPADDRHPRRPRIVDGRDRRGHPQQRRAGDRLRGPERRSRRLGGRVRLDVISRCGDGARDERGCVDPDRPVRRRPLRQGDERRRREHAEARADLRSQRRRGRDLRDDGDEHHRRGGARRRT